MATFGVVRTRMPPHAPACRHIRTRAFGYNRLPSDVLLSIGCLVTQKIDLFLLVLFALAHLRMRPHAAVYGRVHLAPIVYHQTRL